MGLAFHAADTLAVARRLFEAFSEGGTEAICDMLAPDVRAHPRMGGAPMLEGRTAVRDWWTKMALSGTEVEARPLDYELHEDVVIVRGYLRHRDGRTIAENQVFWLFEIHGGLIVRMESHQSRPAALGSLAA
jgi:ketosteroid isomerase-like protein